MSQQLVKLVSPGFVESDGVVCLDSDLVFVRNVTHCDFFGDDGRLHLYELTDGLDVEMVEWLGRSMRFLGIPPVGEPVHRYTYAPAPMHIAVLRDLQEFISNRYSKHWINAVLDTPLITEFATYGAYSRHFDKYRRVTPMVPSAVAWFWWSSELEVLNETLAGRLTDVAIKMVGIQSNVGLAPSSYRTLIEKAWAR
jgi:hypothetical protein